VMIPTSTSRAWSKRTQRVMLSARSTRS